MNEKKEQLALLSKEELIELLLQLLDIQTVSTQNMKQLVEAMAVADDKIRALDSQNKSLEAELMVLRNKP